MNRVREFLRGKKTYITAAIGLAGAVMAWADGQIDNVGLLTALWAALLACFTRVALTARPAAGEPPAADGQ